MVTPCVDGGKQQGCHPAKGLLPPDDGCHAAGGPWEHWRTAKRALQRARGAQHKRDGVRGRLHAGQVQDGHLGQKQLVWQAPPGGGVHDAQQVRRDGGVGLGRRPARAHLRQQLLDHHLVPSQRLAPPPYALQKQHDHHKAQWLSTGVGLRPWKRKLKVADTTRREFALGLSLCFPAGENRHLSNEPHAAGICLAGLLDL